MQTTRLKRVLSLVLCVVLIAAMALFTGCSDTKKTAANEGEKAFTLLVVDGDGNEKRFEITSNAATVGEALLAEKLIAGEDGPYGLYIKTVDGITVDYNKDGAYWSFYVGDTYATSGVDTTEIQDGQTYSLKVEKG